MTTTADEFLERARSILAGSPLVDGHNDLAYALRERVGLAISTVDLRQPVGGLHTDIPRLRAGGVGGQFWSVWVPARLPEHEALPMALEQLDIVHRLVDGYPEAFRLATTAAQVQDAFASGRIASLIGLEGGSMIAGSLAVLRDFHARGVRYLTLTHWRTTRWADSATDESRHGGMTAFGREVVHEMNRLGMMVDLSHVAPSTMSAALEVGVAPVVFSHSGARAVNDHPRNVPDDILRRIPANGGVVLAVFLSQFVSAAVTEHVRRIAAEEAAHAGDHPDASGDDLHAVRLRWMAEHPGPTATLAQVADHIDHLARVMGPAHVGIGSDFDGGALLPDGLEDVSRFPFLIAELLRRGYTDDEVRGIAGGNLLRVLGEVEAVSDRLRPTRRPSEATIEELDGPT